MGLPFGQGMHQYVYLGINFRYFLARRAMFVKYSQAFVCLPGGFGTFDELFEALTLVQTKKVTKFPVVLLGTAYWGGLVEWIREQAAGNGYISPGDIDLLHVTDDIEEAVDMIDHAWSEFVDSEPPQANLPDSGNPTAGE